MPEILISGIDKHFNSHNFDISAIMILYMKAARTPFANLAGVQRALFVNLRIKVLAPRW